MTSEENTDGPLEKVQEVPQKDIEIDLTDCLLKHMEINISESEKRSASALNIRDYYTVYLIETRIIDRSWALSEHGLGQIWRRYSEFELLRRYLCSTYPWAVIPPLPEKKHTFPTHSISSDIFDPDFVDRRRAGLENFLHRVASHPIISKDGMFLMFLQQEEEWKNSIKDTGYLQLAEDKLKTLSAGVRVKETDPDFEAIRKCTNDIENCLTNVLRIRAKAASKLYNIHKLHAGYGKIFSEWSAIEKEMGDGLQKAGHFFDSIYADVGSALEDEEQIVDQLKEYLYYCSSLEDVCCKRDVLQLELEGLQDALQNKRIEKGKIQQGKSGLMSRIVGTVDTEETRAIKIGSIDQKIEELERSIVEKKEQLADFKTRAIEDIENFQKTKVADLSETLENYVKLQIKLSRKGLQTWSNISECVTSIPS